MADGSDAPGELRFLADGGETGALMRGLDWSGSPLGAPAGWPQSLRSVVSLMLGSKFPMFVAWGPELGFLYNDPYAEILGAKHPAAMGRRFHDIWVEIWGDIKPLIDAALAGEATYRENLPLLMNRRGFDEQTWFTFSYSPVRDESGRVAGMYCVCTETTAQVRAAAELKASEERTALALQAARLGTFDWNVGTGAVQLDARSREIFGFTADQAICEDDVFARIHPDDLGPVRAKVDSAFRSRESSEVEYRLCLPDGGQRIVCSYGDPVIGPDGEATGMVGVFEDVTETRETEARVREAESDYRYALDLSPQTIWSSGPDGLLDRVGQRWTEWTGSSGLGTSWGDVLHPDDLQPSIDAWVRSITTGVPYDIWHRARMVADGSYRWMHSRAYARRDEAGNIVRWYGTTEDVDDVKRAEDASRESEERLRLVVDNATDYAIFTMDPHRRVTSWSAGAAAIFGWSADEMIGWPADRLFTPEDLERQQPEHEVREALDTGCANDQRWHVRKDGTRVFMNGSVRPLPPGPDGAPAGVMKIARDETEARRAADALAESESRFRNMADHAPVMMWVTDATGFCTYLNKSWYDYTGQTRQEAEGFGWLDATHPDDKAEAERAFVEANAARAAFRVEYRLRRADGAYRWAIDAASPRFDADGAYLGYVGSVIDIDERREMEQALQDLNATLEQRVVTALAEREEANALYQGYFRHSAEALFVIDVDEANRFLIGELNPAHEAATGFSTAEHRGRDLAELLPPDSYEQVVRYYRRAIETGEVQHYQDEFVMNGEARHWDTVLVPVRGSDGRIIRLIGSSRDKTAQVLAEDALRQAQKMEAVGQLTGGIAHDFNNLLGAMVGSFDLIRRKPEDTARVRRFAEAGLHAGERGAKLTAQLLAFSRAQRIEMKPLRVAEVLEGMKELLARTLGHQVQLRLDLLDAGAAVRTDATQLEMAVLNLAINARDAMPDGGELAVRSERRLVRGDHELKDGTYVALSVRDTGTGMTPEVMVRAFDPFFTTKGVGKGTGLGLSQVYGLSRQSGGTVRVDSRVGAGTTITILLPITDAPAAPALAMEPSGASANGGGVSVLVVDDDADVRQIFGSTLESLGYRVREADGGAAALAMLEEGTPDLAIVDFAMPGMNGAELADAIRARYPGLPVLFASGYADTDAIEAVAGPDATVLRKPFRVHELQAVLATVLGERAGT